MTPATTGLHSVAPLAREPAPSHGPCPQRVAPLAPTRRGQDLCSRADAFVCRAPVSTSPTHPDPDETPAPDPAGSSLDGDPIAQRLDHILSLTGAARETALLRYCKEDPELASTLRARMDALGAFGLLDLDAQANTEIPARIGEYRVLELLGTGGMGMVYRAHQESLGRDVALKVLRADSALDPARRARFSREAETIARLDHPHIVPVHDSGNVDGAAYLAMGLVDGTTLTALLDTVARAPKPDRLAAIERCIAPTAAAQLIRAAGGPRATWGQLVTALLIPIADALAHAHARGVVHRDVKPSNLIIATDGRVMLLDFGLASLRDDVAMTRTGTVIGSVPYMAPEQIEGRAADARSDVFSLGAVLHELLVLRPAFDPSSVESGMRSILTADPTDVDKIDPALHRDLAAVVARCLEKDPARRYPTAAALRDDLVAYGEGQPVQARPLTRAFRIARAVRRRPVAAAVGAALVLAVISVTGLTGYVLGRGDEIRAGAATLAENAREARLATAFGHLVRGEMDTARSVFTEAVERWPEDPLASAMLALVDRGDQADALAPTGDASVDAFLRGLHESAYGSSFAAAECSMRTAVIRAPRPRLLFHIGLAQAVGRLDDERISLPVAEAIQSLWPDSPHGAYWAAYAMLETHSERAAALLDRAIALDPGFAPAHADRGALAYKAGDYESAVEHYARAAELEPDNARAHLCLGIAQRQQGDFEAGIASQRRALAIDPEFAGAHYNLGVALAERDPEAAIEAFEAAVRVAPSYSLAWHNLGTLRMQRGELKEAIAAFEGAVKASPKTTRMLHALATAHAHNGDAQSAARCYEKYVQLAPTDRAAHDYLCQLLDHLGQTEALDREKARFAVATQKN